MYIQKYIPGTKIRGTCTCRLYLPTQFSHYPASHVFIFEFTADTNDNN